MMRGTLYIVVDGRPIHRYVAEFQTDNVLEFKREIERLTRQAGAVPTDAVFEFGPIGRSWEK